MAGYLFAGACVVMLCSCYWAGRSVLSPLGTAAIAAVALGVTAAQFAVRPPGPTSVTGFVAAYLVFAVLPLLAGRYVAAQRKAVERERLQIASEMHDSLGRRLTLAAVQAAALEVSDLPGPQRAAVARLATAVRASVTELHVVLGVLRSEQAQGMPSIDGLIEEFRAAGVVVAVCSGGPPWPLAPPVGEAAYRVIEEGLTNATRHAPGRPVAVTIAWETSALLLTVVNPADCPSYTPGSGLTQLAQTLKQTGGCLSHQITDGQFRLFAALPARPGRDRVRRLPVTALGLTTGIFLLVVLPAVVLLGGR
jgi:signal transduction histidine kinase